jgi:hypothetical protein
MTRYQSMNMDDRDNDTWSDTTQEIEQILDMDESDGGEAGTRSKRSHYIPAFSDVESEEEPEPEEARLKRKKLQDHYHVDTENLPRDGIEESDHSSAIWGDDEPFTSGNSEPPLTPLSTGFPTDEEMAEANEPIVSSQEDTLSRLERAQSEDLRDTEAIRSELCTSRRRATMSLGRPSIAACSSNTRGSLITDDLYEELVSASSNKLRLLCIIAGLARTHDIGELMTEFNARRAEEASVIPNRSSANAVQGNNHSRRTREQISDNIVPDSTQYAEFPGLA